LRPTDKKRLFRLSGLWLVPLFRRGGFSYVFDPAHVYLYKGVAACMVEDLNSGRFGALNFKPAC
jgi:hypothetical protein